MKEHNPLYSLSQLEKLIDQFICDEMENTPFRLVAATVLHTFIAWLRQQAEREARKPRRIF